MKRIHYIDGLRGVAVLAVIFYHFFPNLHITFSNCYNLNLSQGGFLGVDIFFVISGFVISLNIFTEINKNKFNFLIFYQKRVKRIFPALILCLSACIFIGYFSLMPDEYKQIGRHIKGAASFSNNLILFRESGYFDNNSKLKPLMHLWSLSIEEQFYMLFPLIIFFTYKKISFYYMALFIFLTSFIAHISQIDSNPIKAFYLPHLRIWELMIGSISAEIFVKRNIIKKKLSSLFFLILIN